MDSRAKPSRALRTRDIHVEPVLFTPNRFHRLVVDVAAVVVLTGMVIALGGKRIGTGGFSWSDAPIHAMDGALLHDLMADWENVGDIEDWVRRYYARYPCLGLVVFYPPLHPIVEGAAYRVFGISEAVARGTVVAMAVVAVLGLYWLGVQMFNRPAACLAAGLLATAPFGVAWLRMTMLEWSAVAPAILAAGCYQAWYHRPGWGWAILGALATCAALLTKQTTVFLLVLFLTHLVTVGVVAELRENWPTGLRHRRYESGVRMALTVAAAALIILVVLGLYDRVSSRYAEFSRFLVSGRPPWAHLGRLDNYTQYIRWFDTIFGWPFLLAWVTGLTVVAVRWQWQGSRFSLLWLLLVWVQQTLVAWKEPRYFFFALPAAALLAGRGWTIWLRWRGLPLGFIPVAGLIGYQFVVGLQTPASRLPDYSGAVQVLVERGDADVVLMDGLREGQFVFDVRTNAKAAGRIITLRGSKMLYSRAARGRWRHTTHRGRPEEIIELLDEFGVRYVVVESQLPAIPPQAQGDWDEPASRALRELLADTTRFELIGRFSLKCEDPIWDNVELRVYHYPSAPPRRAKSVKIPIPALRQTVVVPLP